MRTRNDGWQDDYVQLSTLIPRSLRDDLGHAAKSLGITQAALLYEILKLALEEGWHDE
jgi:hypothetical protein